MPALGFKQQFAPAVADGRKPHSIRARRRRPFKVGDDLSFYTGMRTKACRRLRANTPCTAAVPIEVNSAQRYVILSAGSRFYTEGRLSDEQLHQLAERDGFESLEAFWNFFATAHGPILCGQVVEWETSSRGTNPAGR